jgi:penicillin-binding protein 2
MTGSDDRLKAGARRAALVGRVPILQHGFVVLLVLIASFYWFVQLVDGAYYRELAENNRLRQLPIKAPRGLIHDVHGSLLVENVPSYNLRLDRSQATDLERSLDFAAEVLGQTPAGLMEVLERYRHVPSFAPVLLAEDLPLSEVARFTVASLEHPEFEIEARPLRLYRHGQQAAHALGHLGEVTQREIERSAGLYRPGDLLGKEGIEQSRDIHLRGIDGERVLVVDSHRRPVEVFEEDPATPGAPLRLTLDLELQQIAARYMQDKVGAVVALDPDTGAIRVLLSSPSFDPNIFSRRLRQSDWLEVINAPHDPLQNRAIHNSYSPGSVFKIIMGIAGVSEGIVTTQEKVFCGGATRVYGRRFRCWKRAGHGWVDLHESIKQSCDVYFYHLGQKLGIRKIAEYARRFGLGRETGIDITGETGGLVPDPEWSQRVRSTPWYPGETISVSIGQGPVLVTPVQMATMMAIVANGGHRVTPHLVEDESVPAPRRLQLDAGAMEVVRQALWAVVTDRGTGARARVEGLDVHGKTGTVQVIRQETWIDSEDLPWEKRDHAWFASFAAAGDDRLVVVVFVEHGGKGSQAAAPLAKLIFEEHYASHLGDRGEA